MNEVDKETRNKIANGLRETAEKRKRQKVSVYEFKIDIHHIAKKDKEKLTRWFKEAKWAYNDCLATENIMAYNYAQHKTITRLDKDGNKIEEKLTLPSVYHAGIINNLKQNLVTLSKSKKHGIKVGALKFKSEINHLPMRTGFLKIKDIKTVSIPGFKNLKVYGLKQIEDRDFDVANSVIIRKASGFYIKATIYFNDYKKHETTNKQVGLDFGIKDNIVTSDREVFNCNVQESEYLKYLQKQLHRKVKNSKRYCELKNQIAKEQEHLANKRKDYANKTVSYLLKKYDTVYMQDEQIANWHKSKMKGFGKKVQHSYMGTIKAKLKMSKRCYIVPRYECTTRICPECGLVKTKEQMPLSQRIFKCECGYVENRDVNAAKVIMISGSLKRAECLEQASAETSSYTLLKISSILQDVSMKRKQEDSTIYGGV